LSWYYLAGIGRGAPSPRPASARAGSWTFSALADCASGGPLGLVRSGDRIRLSVRERRIDLMVEDAELKQRAAAAKPAPDQPARGYSRLYAQEILGADEGCDFAFLKPR
jgi:dihydroxy-acid dehydratase